MEDHDKALVVKSSEGIQKILISNLVYVEALGRNVIYHLITGKKVVCTELFTSVCANLLKFDCFVKTHRSYIVNMQYIDTIDNAQVVLQNLASIPIAQGRAKEVKEIYLAYQMDEVKPED